MGFETWEPAKKSINKLLILKQSLWDLKLDLKSKSNLSKIYFEAVPMGFETICSITMQAKRYRILKQSLWDLKRDDASSL